MPIYDLAPDETPDLAAVNQVATAAPTTKSKEFANAYLSGGIRTPGVATALTVVGAPIDLADTVSSSLVPGVERGDLNNAFLGAIGSPGLNRWYEENKGAVEVGSGIAGIIASDMIARRVLAPASGAMRVVRSIPFVKKLAAVDAQYANALRVASLTSRELATRGAVGAERFVGVEMNLAALGRPAFAISPKAAASNLKAAQITKGFVQNLTTEGIMAATLHTNSFLYDDDLSHNLAWSAAGLGIGGAIDNVIGSYTLRKIANGQAARRLNAGAYDPSGIEASRVHAFGVANEIGKASEPGTLAQRFTGAGAFTDRITSLAISAKELVKNRGFTERASALFSKREALATPTLKQAFETLNKVTVRGLRGVSKAGFGGEAEGLIAPLKESLEREPASMFGIEEIGTVVDNMTRRETALLRDRNVKVRFNEVQELLQNDGKWSRKRKKDKAGKEFFEDTLIPLSDEGRLELQAEARDLHYASSHVPVTMFEPGEWVPMSLGDIADDFEPRQILRESIGGGEDGLQLWQRARKDPKEPSLGIRSDGELYLPGNHADPSRLDTKDMLNLYHAGNSMVRSLAESGGVYTVPKNPTWFHLDLAEQLLKASGNPSSVVFSGKLTRESAQIESFAQKVKALRTKEMASRLANKRGVNATLDEAQIFKNKIHFNLPRLTSYQMGLLSTSEHPMDVLTNAFKSADEVRATPYHELLKGMNDAKKITGFTDDTADTLDSLQGNSFNFMLDRDGNAIKPIVAYKRPLAPAQWSQNELFVRQAATAAHVRDSLMGAGADPITRQILGLLSADPNFAQAGRVMELADDQHRSMVPGFGHAAPQSTMGSLVNAVTSRERRDVDSLTLLAASRIKEKQTRITQQLMREVITGAMGDAITQVNSPRNITSKLLLNQFHSFRQGWEIGRDAVPEALPNGQGYAFVLDHESSMNRKRFEQAYGQSLEKGQKLLTPDGKVLVLDELAFDTLKRMQAVHQVTIEMKNSLLRSQGLKQLSAVPWYVPPPSTKGKYIGYTFDAQNNVVPGMTIIAESPEELSRMKSELVGSKQWQIGWTNRPRSEIESFMDLWDKAQMDFIAPNTTAIQSKKHNFGKSGGNVIDNAAFEEGLITMRDSMIAHGDDILDTVFKEPILSAKSRAAISRVESSVGSRSAEQHSGIFDRYEQNLTGRSSLGAKDSFTGEAFSWAERRLNGMLASDTARTVADTYQSLKDYLSTARPTHGRASVERFKKLTQELGEYMPFKTVNEMLERETGSRTPVEVAAITSKLSWFEAASRLRWLESFHAVANIGGILSNTSAVIRALQPMAGETLAEAGLRNSSLSMMMATPNGNNLVLPHTNKLLWHSMKDAWKKVPDEFTDKAIRLGYMDQEVAEFNRQWGSIDSKEGWRGFVFGNEHADPSAAKGPFGKATAKVAKSGGLDKWLAIVSDKSEAFTRQWGMYAGRRVAESLGIKNVDDQLSFAHDITNKLIANYDPRNRPEVFQGALGAPLGLFQSYVLNYYQRMFRYVETGNGRALATQYAAQSAVFGISSVPGWQALNWAFFDRGQGDGDDPVDSLYKRFGQVDGDLLMHGTLSNLPKLFGADGLSLYTRGDSQIRMPVVNLPVADTIGRVWKGIGAAVDTMKLNNGKIGLNHLAEIASNVVTNRPLAGMLEVFGANGYDTSFDGQVVSEAQGSMESMYRILGVKAMQQQKETELFYQNRAAQEEQAARKSTLNAETRAAIRDGRFEAIPDLFAKYTQQGGDPRYYSRWLKDSFTSATDTRGERMLSKALKDKDGSKNAYIGRLLDAQVGVDEEEQATEDYGQAQEIEELEAQQRALDANPSPQLADPLSLDSEMGSLELP